MFANLFNRLYVIGVLIGFLMCCLAGKYVSETFAYDAPFERFNEYLLRDTNYFPTASSMLNTVLQQSTADQTILLIGGNSVLRGFGQGKSDLWSKKLQALLGDKYKVFNFAMPTGSPNMNAAVIAEILYLQGRKVILVSNSLTAAPPPDLLGNWDNYIFLEALYKNLIDKDQANRKKVSSSWVRFEEVNLAQKLNSYLYFNDLWSYIGYKHFFTVWTSMTQHGWTKPRSSSVFPDADYPWSPRTKEQYVSNQKNDFAYLENIGDFAYKLKDGDPETINSLENMQKMLPDYLKKCTILVLSSENPYVLGKMGLNSRDRFMLSYNLLEKSWQSAGYQTLRIGSEVPYEEWNDAIHFSAPAGSRLASALAQTVLSISRSACQVSPK